MARARACRRSRYVGVRDARWRATPAPCARARGARAARASSSRRGWARRSGIAQGRRGRPSSTAALEAAFAHDPRVIVEAFARRHRGRVLGARADRRAAGRRVPGEIVLPAAPSWYDYEAKYTPGGMELVVPGADLRRGARARCASWRVERLPRAPAAAAWRASTSSSTATSVLRQRAQHDARLHADERLREALGGHAACRTRSSATACVRLALERFERERLRLF